MAITKLTKVDPNHIHHDQNEEELKRPTKKTNFCKRLMKFMFSHIGLILIILIWAVIGGFLFRLLEEHQEIKMCETGKGQESSNIVTLRSKLLTYIQFNITSNPAEIGKDNETVANANIESWLMQFRGDSYDNIQKNSYYGQNCQYPKWNFTQALLFSLTAITTIGYGNIYPKTWEGEVVCICYSVIGIPFVLMCVANISGVLGDMFRYVYSRICCRLCIKKKPRKQPVPNQYDHDLATARPNDVTPVWGPDSEINEKPPFNNDRSPRIADDPPIEEDDDKVAVPLTVTMLIILAYLGIGGVIYMLTEEWSYVQSIYFCFITLATIGFGDFVPGQKANDPDAIYKVVGGFFYILVGMAVIAMSFDLMQDEIVSKTTWLGRKLGVIDPEPDDAAIATDQDNYTEINNIKKHVPNSYVNGSDSGRVSYNNDSFPSSRVASTEPLNQKTEIMSKPRNAYIQNLPASRIQSKS